MKKVKLVVFIILTISCAAAIFMFSAENSGDSTAKSLNVLTALMNGISKVFNIQISENRILEFHHFFRKTAHFSIYAVLSVFLYNSLRLVIADKRRAVYITLILCVLTAVSDEIHQLFVAGRTARVTDVMIDTLGACFGILILAIVGLISGKIRIYILKKK